jgi:hypothetical protein
MRPPVKARGRLSFKAIFFTVKNSRELRALACVGRPRDSIPIFSPVKNSRELRALDSYGCPRDSIHIFFTGEKSARGQDGILFREKFPVIP